MKSYSFVRENAYKVIHPWSKEDETGPAVWYGGQMLPNVGTFSQYLYFLFAPTLLYRDLYPRYCWFYAAEVLCFKLWCHPIIELFGFVSWESCPIYLRLILFINWFCVSVTCLWWYSSVAYLWHSSLLLRKRYLEQRFHQSMFCTHEHWVLDHLLHELCVY